MAVGLAAVAASAQTVVLELRNGDRLSGVLVAESTNRLVLSNAWNPALVLSPEHVLTRSLATSAPPALAASPVPPAGGAVSNALTKPAPPLRQVSGEAQVGIDVISNTKTRQTYYGRAKIGYQEGRFRDLLDVSGSYGRTDGAVDANRVDGANKLDFDLGKRWYAYTLGGLGYDKVRKIDLRGEIGPGAGYTVLQDPNLGLKAEAGFNYVAEDRADGPNYDHFLARLSGSGVWKINQRFTLDHRLEYLPSFEDAGEFRFRGEATLRYWLWGNLSLNLSVVDLYDTSPAPNVPPNDLQVRSALAFKF